jgi:hypothetical protein
MHRLTSRLHAAAATLAIAFTASARAADGIATLRGIDLAAWYTLAWFDKELKGDPTADRRLLSARWRNDAAGAAVDLDGDGNLFAWHFRSPIALRRTEPPYDLVRCDDLRAGCAALVDPTEDGGPVSYSFLEDRGP